MDLLLSQVEATPLSDEWLTKPFERNPGFDDSWWVGDAKGPCIFFSAWTSKFGEVARVQIRTRPTIWTAYPTYMRLGLDPTEIDLLEVRVDQQQRGIGREVAALLRDEFSRRCIALSRDAESDGFWHSLGWTAHSHADAADFRATALLFVQPA